jgi:threonine/homoserine/homoserine lactone efflux protein
MNLFPDAGTLALFVATSLALLVVPGPAVLYVVARSLERGWRTGIVSALGLAGGAVVHILLATLGVTALIQSSRVAFVGLRVVGATYLMYLGARMIVGGQRDSQTGSVATVALPAVFRQGMIVNLSNPKAMLFFFAFLPQFVDPTKGAVAGQLLVLGGVFLVIAFCSDSSWALLAGSLSAWIRKNPVVALRQRYAAGGVLIALGLVAAISVF